MRVHRRSLLTVAAICVGLIPAVLPEAPAGARPVSWGTVLVRGIEWAGPAAALGDLNVYSNGNGNQDRSDAYGLDYECVELAQRWAAVRFGEQPIWPVAYAYQMWDVAPRLRVPFQQLPNGGAVAPQFGDIIVFARTAASPAGHVAVVAGTGLGHVDVVEQNVGLSDPTGWARLPLEGTTIPDRWGMRVIGWLRAWPLGAGMGGPGPGGFTLDGYGGLHPWGRAAPLAQAVSWRGWDIARGLVVQRGRAGGYVLDGFGGIHAFGAAPPVRPTAYWPAHDIGRGIALRPDGRSGYVLDGWGGIHPFGGAPPVVATSYWPGQDMARGIALRPDGVSGYVLDGWGGVHPFGGAPPLLSTAIWPGLDVARGITLRPDGAGGWIVDAWGGVHSVGIAAALPSIGSLPGTESVRGIIAAGDGGGYTITATGRLLPFGDAPPADVSAVFEYPVARGIG
jgi:CHAP domain